MQLDSQVDKKQRHTCRVQVIPPITQVEYVCRIEQRVVDKKYVLSPGHDMWKNKEGRYVCAGYVQQVAQQGMK